MLVPRRTAGPLVRQPPAKANPAFSRREIEDGARLAPVLQRARRTRNINPLPGKAFSKPESNRTEEQTCSRPASARGGLRLPRGARVDSRVQGPDRFTALGRYSSAR